MARFKLPSCIFQDQSGNVISGGTCSVFLAGTSTAASIYTASSGGTAVNSVTSDSAGQCVFYVDNKDYPASQKFDIVMSKTNFTSQTYSDVIIFPDTKYRYYADPSITDQGNASESGSIAEFISDISSDEATIVLGDGTYTFTTSTTTPANIVLKCIDGSLIDGTLTIGKLDVEGPIRQIFASGSTILFSNNAVPAVYANWWGIDGTADDVQFIAAITAARNGRLPVHILGSTSYTINAEVDVYGVDFIGLSSGGTTTTNDFPTFVPTSTPSRTFKMGTTGGTQDFTRFENIKISLANASANHEAIGSDNGVQKKIIRNVEIRGVSSTEVTDNFYGIRFEQAGSESTFYNILNNIHIYNCYNGIYILSDADTTRKYSGNSFSNIQLWNNYNSFILRGDNNHITQLNVNSVPTLAGGNERDYSASTEKLIKIWGNDNSIIGGNIDNQSAVAGKQLFVTNSTIIVGFVDLFSDDSAGASVIQLIDATTGANEDFTARDSAFNAFSDRGLNAGNVNAFQSKFNWIVNPHFESWGNTTARSSPDNGAEVIHGWKASVETGSPTFTITKNTSSTYLQYGAQSLRLNVTVSTNGFIGILQELTDFYPINQIKMQDVITVGAIVKPIAAETSSFVLAVDDGVGQTTVTEALTTDGWHMILLEHSVSGSATKFEIKAGVDNQTVDVYMDSIMFYPGRYEQWNMRPHIVTKSIDTVKGDNVEYASIETTGAGGDTLWSKTLSDETAYYIIADFIAQKDDGSQPEAGRSAVLVHRDGAGATIQHANSEVDSYYLTDAAAAYSVDFATSSNDIQFNVTGEAVTNVYWKARIQIMQLSGTQ